MNDNVVVLAGGTGGAKFVRGVARCVPPEKLTIIVNTGDDVTMHGLRISPDVDIITYTLAGLVDPEKGWGLAGDTFNCLDQLRGYGREGWFALGDRDLATHIQRTNLLAQGKPPSEVADLIRQLLGVRQRILPMTDQEVETHVQLAGGALLHFQDYLIARGAPDDVQAVVFQNIGAALPAAGVLQAIDDADILLIAPSSPVVSIGTILSVNGIFDAIQLTRARAAAVSPLRGGTPIAGPSAALMRAFGLEVSNTGLCDAYGPLIDLLVIHEQDAGDRSAIAARDLRVLAIDTLMPNVAESVRVARAVLQALDYPVVEVALPEPTASGAPASPSRTRGPRTEPDVQAEARTLRVRVTELERELATVRHKSEAAVQAARRDAGQAADDARVAWDEHDAQQQAVQELQHAVSEAREEAAEAQEEAEVAWAECDAAQRAVEDARSQAAAAADETAAAHAQDRTALEHRLSEARRQAETQGKTTEARIRDLERERDAAHQAAVGAEMHGRDEHDAAAHDRESLRMRIATLEGELEAARNRMADSVAKAETTLRDTEADLAKQAGTLEAAAAEWEQQRAAWEAERDALQAERDQAETDRAEAERGAAEARAKLDSSTEQWEAAFRSLEAQREEQVASLATETERAAAVHAETVASLAKLERRLEAQAAKFSSRAAQYEERIGVLEAQVEEQRQRRRRLRRRYKAELGRARTVVADLRGQIENLRATATVPAAAPADQAPDAGDTGGDDDRVAQLHADVRSLTGRLAAAEAALAASEAQVARLQEAALPDDSTAHAGDPASAPTPLPSSEAATSDDEAGRAPDMQLPPESLQWKPAGADRETMAARARRRGRDRH